MTRFAARGLVTWTIGMMALVPAAAQACPACAGRETGSSISTWLLLAGMIGVPYLVGSVVFRVIRAIERGDQPAARLATVTPLPPGSPS